MHVTVWRPRVCIFWWSMLLSMRNWNQRRSCAQNRLMQTYCALLYVYVSQWGLLWGRGGSLAFFLIAIITSSKACAAGASETSTIACASTSAAACSINRNTEENEYFGKKASPNCCCHLRTAYLLVFLLTKNRPLHNSPLQSANNKFKVCKGLIGWCKIAAEQTGFQTGIDKPPALPLKL